MKKFLLILSVLSLGLIISCENESNEYNLNSNKNSFFDVELGKITYNNGKKTFNITLSRERFFKNFKNTLKETGLNLEPVDFYVFEDNNKNYLRVISKKNYITTVELISINNTFRTGKTSCTSVACASGGGCIPDGSYCTKCNPSDPGLAGDCTRTTSNELTPAP